jgi:hypothetical protein
MPPFRLPTPPTASAAALNVHFSPTANHTGLTPEIPPGTAGAWETGVFGLLTRNSFA